MKTIYLHGYLKEQFGEKYRFDVPSPSMAVCALRSQLRGFAEAVRDGHFVIIRGPKDTGFSIDEKELELKFGKTNELHIIPVIAGAGGRAGMVVKIVVGVALLATGIGGAILAPGAALAWGGSALSLGALGSVSWGAVASLGVAVTLAGVSSMLASRPNLNGLSYEQRERPEERPSFLYNGPVNVSQEGLPVPLVYGRMRVGSVVVSSGMQTEKI